MFSGHAIHLHRRTDSDERLLEDHVAEDGSDDGQCEEVLFSASFEDLAENHVQYDTVIWVLISLLLVLAWGIGFIMLLYLPIRRHSLKKDLASRRLLVTSDKIVYEATRPSICPFSGLTEIKKHIPLHLVIDTVIEQGCLQSIYGIHTFRIASINHGKAAPVDELQLQGVSEPELLRKVIIIESAKSIQEFGHWKSTTFSGDGMPTAIHARSSDTPYLDRRQSPSMKVKAKRALGFGKKTAPGDLLLHKVEEVRLSVQRLESLVATHSQA